MNSVLFAQLAADKKFSDHTEDRKWYAYFVKVLSKLDYILNSQSSMHKGNQSMSKQDHLKF